MFKQYKSNIFSSIYVKGDWQKGNYIPAAIRIELRQEAVSQGLIQGVASDYQQQQQQGSQPAKSVYK